MNSESSIVLPVLGISKFGDGRCVLGSVGHAHGGGVCERGKGARGHPGTWESHLVLRTLAGKKGRHRLTNDPVRNRSAFGYGSLPPGGETNSKGASAVSVREGDEARAKTQGQS